MIITMQNIRAKIIQENPVEDEEIIQDIESIKNDPEFDINCMILDVNCCIYEFGSQY